MFLFIDANNPSYNLVLTRGSGKNKNQLEKNYPT